MTLWTNNLEGQKHFYKNIFGLELIENSIDTASFRIGRSILMLKEGKHAMPYHFAINIPANKIVESLNWLEERVEVIKEGDKSIHQFEGWNAEAIYFYDADGNIAELISRKNLNNSSDDIFSIKSLLEISEIGIPTEDIGSLYKTLSSRCGLEIYSGDMGQFCAIGDEYGLFVCIDINKKTWFPTNEIACLADFKILFEIEAIEYEMKRIGEELIFSIF